MFSVNLNFNKIIPIIKIEFYSLIEYCFLVQIYLFKNILKILKHHFKFYFKILTCLSVIDLVKNKNRFKIIYEILSIKFNFRIKIKISINEITPIFSLEKIYIGSIWWEFECWDMFGIIFLKKNYNIVRLLTDYGFNGFPLRKDFPLSGFLDSKYNTVKNRISYENIELSQNYRIFAYDSPWENFYFK